MRRLHLLDLFENLRSQAELSEIEFGEDTVELLLGQRLRAQKFRHYQETLIESSQKKRSLIRAAHCCSAHLSLVQERSRCITEHAVSWWLTLGVKSSAPALMNASASAARLSLDSPTIGVVTPSARICRVACTHTPVGVSSSTSSLQL